MPDDTATTRVKVGEEEILTSQSEKEILAQADTGEELMPGIAFMENEFELWGELRKQSYHVMMHAMFEAVMTSIIVFNIILMIIEVDAVASCPEFQDTCAPEYVHQASTLLLVIYTAELLLRVFVERARFHKIKWNLLDTGIVLCAYVEIVMDGVVDGQVLSTIRMLRLLRILRAVRLFRHITDLYRLVVGFISTMRAIFWGFIMLLCLSFMLSIITMQIVQDYRDMSSPDDWCVDAFSSTVKTVLFYFQTLIAGDSWGTCVVPMVRKDWKLFILFSSGLATINLGFTNLILSVIVDNAHQGREDDVAQQLQEEKEKERANILSLYATMQRIDKDSSGSLSLSDLMDGFEDDREAQCKLLCLGLDQQDLASMFKALDLQDSDQMSYKDFAKTFHKAGKTDQRTQLMIIGLQLTKLTHSFDRRMENLESKMLAVLSRQSADACLLPKQIVPSATLAPVVEQSFLPKVSMSQLYASELPINQDFNQDQLVSDMAALEEELRRMGVDLGERLQSLAQEAEKHRAAVSRHATTLGFQPRCAEDSEGRVEKADDLRDTNRKHVADSLSSEMDSRHTLSI